MRAAAAKLTPFAVPGLGKAGMKVEIAADGRLGLKHHTQEALTIMRISDRTRFPLAAGFLLALAAFAPGQAAEPAPGGAAGSPDVLVNGKPAQRAGDKVNPNGLPPETSSNVFINGKPAAIGNCPNGHSESVFVNGKPVCK